MSATDAPGEFLITRLLDAPRQRVWQAWTEADRLEQWWGPKGLDIEVASLDLRPGGLFHYVMRTPDGTQMWGRFVYRDIVAPQTIVWLNAFSDAQGGVSRHPGAPGWPAQMLSSVQLDEQGEHTLLTLRSRAFEASPAEQQTFIDGFDSMRQGFGGTFEQLVNYLRETA